MEAGLHGKRARRRQTKHSGVEAEEEVAWQARGHFFILSCKKKERLIIEVITLLEYANNF
jgi:hypothetical protein